MFQGLLSFLSAPLLGALSDVWGRKVFLLVTVFFTCAPIPLMRLNTWYEAGWYQLGRRWLSRLAELR